MQHTAATATIPDPRSPICDMRYAICDMQYAIRDMYDVRDTRYTYRYTYNLQYTVYNIQSVYNSYIPDIHVPALMYARAGTHPAKGPTPVLVLGFGLLFGLFDL
jgi:hypothetical protein